MSFSYFDIMSCSFLCYADFLSSSKERISEKNVRSVEHSPIIITRLHTKTHSIRPFY